MTYGQAMKKARMDRGITRSKLAEWSGVNITSILNYEQDVTNPSLFNVVALADTLKISIDEYVGLREYADFKNMTTEDISALPKEQIAKMFGRMVADREFWIERANTYFALYCLGKETNIEKIRQAVKTLLNIDSLIGVHYHDGRLDPYISAPVREAIRTLDLLTRENEDNIGEQSD